MGNVIAFKNLRKTDGMQVECGSNTSRMHCHPSDKNVYGATYGYFHLLDMAQIYALKAFCQTLAGFRRCYRVRLPNDFMEIMQDSKGELPERISRKLLALPEKKKQELIFAMVSAVHDGWVRDNPRYFFDSRYADERFLFLRIELCGVYVFDDFLEMIMDLIWRLHINTGMTRWDAECIYHLKRHEFVVENNLTMANLAKYIAGCGRDYMALSPKISNALWRDPVLVDELVKQVGQRAPLGSVEYR